MIEAMDGSVELAEGLAQGVLFWVEYSCRTSNATSCHGSRGDHFDVISTASSSHRQTVRKLPKSIAITEADVKAGSKFCCEASFDDDPDRIEDHSFTFKFCRQEDEMN
mmetsp:Transcript_3590/g.5608  ORF Transcript_3590/g.5608 Transcript_3590/m.5608 type:complete len:108 (-) Transcript_3590:143-466(-)